MTHHSKKPALFYLGALAAVILFVGIRLAFMPETTATHFHANFAMFLNGKRIDLSADKYMEDVAGCKPEYLDIQPEERTHMHNNDMNVVHVHDKGVTWGHFMANIGFAFGKNYLATDDERIYVNGQGRTIKFILNGEPVENPFNQLIKSEDRLLISFGYETIPQLMKDQYSVVASDAHEHNEHPDPGSCSGAIELGFWDKVKKAIWF